MKLNKGDKFSIEDGDSYSSNVYHMEVLSVYIDFQSNRNYNVKWHVDHDPILNGEAEYTEEEINTYIKDEDWIVISYPTQPVTLPNELFEL